MILCGLSWPLDRCTSPSLRKVRLEEVLQVPGMALGAPVLNVHCINHHSRYVPSSAGGTVLASGEMPSGALSIVKALSSLPAASPAMQVTKCSQQKCFLFLSAQKVSSRKSELHCLQYCTFSSSVNLYWAIRIFLQEKNLSYLKKENTCCLNVTIPWKGLLIFAGAAVLLSFTACSTCWELNCDEGNTNHHPKMEVLFLHWNWPGLVVPKDALLHYATLYVWPW